MASLHSLPFSQLFEGVAGQEMTRPWRSLSPSLPPEALLHGAGAALTVRAAAAGLALALRAAWEEETVSVTMETLKDAKVNVRGRI